MPHRVHRRSFLAGLAGVAAVPLLGCRSESAPGLDAKAIIIGSGFGGAVAALRLAEAGVSTLILERGRRWPVTDKGDTFATYDKPDPRCAWLIQNTNFPGAPYVRFDRRYIGVLERIDAGGTSVFTGAGYGGGSLVYGATLVQPPKALFEKVFPKEIDYAEMDAVYFPRARAAIGATPIPDDVLAAPTYESSRKFFADCAKAGVTVLKNDVGVDWNRVRDELAGRAVPSATIGQIVYGANSGAKNSVDRNYLALAERTGRVTVRTQHVVTDIGRDDVGFVVTCDRIDEEGNVIEKVTLRSQYLFLAAGSMGTSKLLVRAKAKGTLPALSAEVGQHWGNNGDYVMAREIGQDTIGIQGGPPSGMVFDHQNPLGPVTLDHGSAATGFECRCQPILGMGLAQATGSFKYEPSRDDVLLTWDPKGMGSIREAITQSLGVINAAAGGTVIDATEKLGNYTYHPLGGAVLGKACDFYGRVVGYPKLYVVDGALIEGSAGCVNPALTIAALAERNLDRIVKEDFG